MNPKTIDPLPRVLQLLDLHHGSFCRALPFADETYHPVACDTRAWSQILVSILTGIPGQKRKKGSDLVDGSDVKAAITWKAIDTPRFNGVLKAGTKAEQSDKLESLDGMPYLFFVLWDRFRSTEPERCRVWCVRPQKDRVFRNMCKSWYDKRAAGEITSANFQLHPPREKDSDLFRNTCGNLIYPLLLSAERDKNGFHVVGYHPEVLRTGKCKQA
jgi:hypothetical protein